MVEMPPLNKRVNVFADEKNETVLKISKNYQYISNRNFIYYNSRFIN